jgi:hypothetical protein
VTTARVSFVTEALLRSKPFTGSSPQPYWTVDGQFRTHKHQADGYYVLDSAAVAASFPSGTNLDPASGKWLLSVQDNANSPVAQRITLKATKGVLRATAGWSDHPSDKGQTAKARTAATVDLAYFAKGADKAIPAEHTIITAVLYPRKEIVFLGGVDYEVADARSQAYPYATPDDAFKPQAGTRFELFAESRRADLLAASALDKGTRVTFLAARTGIRRTTVKAGSGWLTVDRERTGTHRYDPNSISILDLYGYLNSVGALSPGIVQEAGIFSHAWVGGPIIRNTYDQSGSATVRDPDDRDARPKDWNATGVMASYPKLGSAFSIGARFQTWGCNHPVLIRAQIQAALTRLHQRTPPFPRTKLFSAASSYKDHEKKVHFEIETASLDHLRFAISRYFNAPGGAWSYLGAAVHYLSIPCWGAPIGAGSNYVNNRMVITGPEGDPVLDYLKLEFGLPATAIEGRYIDYQTLKSVSFATPLFSSGRWYGQRPVDWTFAGRAGPWSSVKLHNGRYAFRPSSISVTTSSPTPPIVAGSPGLLYDFPTSVPDRLFRIASAETIVFKKDSHFDSGLFVQDNGNVWIVQRARPRGAWTVYTAPVLHERLTRSPGDSNNWISSGALLPLAGGLFADSATPTF